MSIDNYLKNDFLNCNISYYRTDGVTHRPLTILNKPKLHPIIQDTWCKEVPADYDKKNMLLTGSKIILAKALKIGTPASIYFHIEKNKKIKVEDKKKIILKDEDKYYNIVKNNNISHRKGKLKRKMLRFILDEIEIENANLNNIKHVNDILENNLKVPKPKV